MNSQFAKLRITHLLPFILYLLQTQTTVINVREKWKHRFLSPPSGDRHVFFYQRRLARYYKCDCCDRSQNHPYGGVGSKR
jgi:hypothetical protein